MTDHKHTHGPWTLDPESERVYANRQPRVIGGGKLITVVGNIESGAEYEWHANARLIAAAPELLEALRLAMPLLEAANARCTNDTAFIAVARAAIAKATGETP